MKNETRVRDKKERLRFVVEQIRGHYEALQTAGGDDRYFIAMRVTRAAFGYSEEHPKAFPPRILNRIGMLERKIVMGKAPEVIEQSVEELLRDLEGMVAIGT